MGIRPNFAKAALSFSLIFVLLLSVVVFAFATKAGSAWVVSTLANRFAPTIKLEEFEGRLIDGFSVGYLEVSVDENKISIHDLDFAWRASSLVNRKLVVRRLSAKQVTVAATPASETEKSTASLSLPHLPFTLDIQNLSIHSLGVLIEGAKHQLENIELVMKWTNKALEIKQLTAAMSEQQFKLVGTLQNETPLYLDGRAEWTGAVDTVPSTAALNFKGPLNALAFDATTDGFFMTRADGNVDITDPALAFSANVDHGEKRLSAESEMRIESGALNVSGSMKVVKIRYELRGNTGANEKLLLIVEGQASGLDAMDDGIDGSFDYRIGHPLLLESALEGRTVVALKNDRLTIENITEAPFASELEASLNPGDFDQQATVAISWNNFRVPGLPEGELVAQGGQIDFSGTRAAANVSLDSTWSHSEFGLAHIETKGVLTEEKLTLTDGLAEVIDGTISFAGLVDWRQVPNVNLKVDATQLDVSVIRPDLDAQINLAAEVRLDAPESGLQTAITVERLTGTWLGQKLLANGKVQLNPNNTVIDNLQAAIGDNRVALDLVMSDKLVGKYEINAPDLASIDTQLRGRLEGSGRFAGTPKKPTLDGKLTGKDLQIYSWMANAFDLDYNVSPFSTRLSNVKGDLVGLRQKNNPEFAANASFQAEGNVDKHNAVFEVDTNNSDLSAELSASWREDQWRGALDALTIRDDTFGDWALREKSKFVVKRSGDFKLLDQLCVEQNAAGLCLNSAQRDKERVKMDGELMSLPIALLNPWLPGELKTNGKFSAEFAVDQSKEGFRGTGKYAIKDGSITALLEEDTRREIPIENFSGRFDATTEIAVLGLTTQIGDWLDLQIDARVPTTPGAAIEANVDGVSENIAWISEFIPDLAGSNGRVEITGRVSGKRDNPEIDLAVGLKSGTLALPATGLRFSTFDLGVKSTQADVLAIDLHAKPQKGELNLAGKLTTRPDENWPFQFTVAGDAFSAARLPELELDITPSIDVIGNREKIAVTGTVQIPYFSYTLNEIPKSAVRVSSDTVIVSDNDIDAPALEAAGNWFEESVFIDVDVQLGDQVSVAGLGMFATLAGGVEVAKALDDEIKGAGTVLIASGNFDAYGQSLSINNGRMMFAGPITNPTLNVRAVRDNIPVVAGVAITGTARAPKFDVFSDPGMTDAEALSYVVTGRPLGEGSSADAALISQAALGFGLDQSSVITNQLRDLFALDEFGLNAGGDIDQTALIAGKQITPKVLVRTEMNIFDQLWSFFLRYKLTEKWSLEAESGERQGADIIYNVESESIRDFNPFK